MADRNAEDLRDAVTWFLEETLSTSSVEALCGRVLQIADRIEMPNVVRLADRRTA